MNKTLLLTSLLVLIVASFFGVFGTQMIEGLEAEVSSIEEYDDTTINATLNELITSMNTLNKSDIDSLQSQIETMNTLITSLNEYDDTTLDARVSDLETLVSELTSVVTTLQSEIEIVKNNGSSLPTLYVDDSGKYLDFREISDKLCYKYFNFVDEWGSCNNGGNESIKSINIFFNESNILSSEEIVARMALFYEELASYTQYLKYIESIQLDYSYRVGETHYRISAEMPSLYLMSGHFTFEDLLPSFKWNMNVAVSEIEVDGMFEESPIVIDLTQVETLYNDYKINNNFGDNVLSPLE